MLAALPERETDRTGRWAKVPVGLGWRGPVFRAGATAKGSPRFDGVSGLAIAASARLDGSASLCEALGLPRPDRAEIPDNALILKAYARWGRACPEHLLGDFAFALWDARREMLFCARDHIGARPFYYAFAGERFAFASDMGAVLAAPGVSGDLDEAVVATRLTYGSRPFGERTFYRDIRRLLPGHALTVERRSVRVHRWWHPEEVPARAGASDAALAEECRALVSEAVRDRLRDARRVGVHLSGGLDSSGVAALAARELRKQERAAPLAFAWHPPIGSNSGSTAQRANYRRIEAVQRQEGLHVNFQAAEAGDVVGFLRRDGIRYDESTLMHEQVTQRAAAEQGVEVLLSGWGGDEGISFNGRGYCPQLLQGARVGRLWGELRERGRRPLTALLTDAALPLVSPAATRAARRLWRGRWPLRKNVTFIHPEFATRVQPLPAEAALPRAGVRNVQVYLLQLGHLSQRMEGWAASGTHHGIEYRYPLLDRRVLEFALGLPAEQYRRGPWSRWLMRRAFDPVLPPEVCWNADKGGRARRGPLRDSVVEALTDVRGLIEDRPAPPTRGRYLDLPRLLEELDPERSRNNRRRAPVLNALRFLDF